jgi:hypothetical protein
MGTPQSTTQEVVFVVGSKPNPQFPDIAPDRIYAVNGAIGLTNTASCTEFIGVVSWSVIFSEKTQDVKTRKQWRKCRVDRLIVAGGANSPKTSTADAIEILKAEGLEFNNIEFCGNKYKKKIFQRRLGCRLAKEIAIRLSKSSLKTLIHELRRTVSLPEIGVSGGVRALVIADTEAPKNACIYLIGVGARKSRGHYYDNTAVFEKHALEDRNFLVDYYRKRSARVIVTDPVLARFLRSLD